MGIWRNLEQINYGVHVKLTLNTGLTTLVYHKLNCPVKGDGRQDLKEA